MKSRDPYIFIFIFIFEHLSNLGDDFSVILGMTSLIIGKYVSGLNLFSWDGREEMQQSDAIPLLSPRETV
jgi:hypothetical protein